jgi:uncharacterized membrane protein
MRVLRLTFVFSAITWAMALPLATTAAARHGALGSTIAYGFALFVYAVASFLCHQRPERSFHVFAAQLPVCARCVGIYAGAAMAAMLCGLRSEAIAGDTRRRSSGVYGLGSTKVAVLASAVPIGLTLVYELATGDVPSNWIRALSGVPLGVSVAWVVCSVG